MEELSNVYGEAHARDMGEHVTLLTADQILDYLETDFYLGGILNAQFPSPFARSMR